MDDVERCVDDSAEDAVIWVFVSDDLCGGRTSVDLFHAAVVRHWDHVQLRNIQMRSYGS